jgi:ATP-dependent DNA helicase RecG
MTGQEILKLIQSKSRKESQTVELKRRPSSNIGESICAFANTTDGTILVGVTDEGKVTGASVKMESQIANIAHSCKPAVYPHIESSRIEGKTILVIEVSRSKGLIHSYKNIAYKRVGSHDMPLSPDEVIEYAKNTGRIRFDEQICEDAAPKDIDGLKLREFVVRARTERGLKINARCSSKEILRRLELCPKDRLTNAALLLFGKAPQRFLLQAELRCARFKGTKPLKFIDMKVSGGTVIDQVEDALTFIQKHIELAADIKGLEREERWEYPIEALREAVVNAICHRDYEASGNVQVRIFDDRIEIWNPGGLPFGLKVKDLKKEHESKPRNRLIAKVFFLIRLIEQWGTGTNRLIEETIQYGLPEPEFEDKRISFVVTFRKSKLTEEYLKEMGLNERQRKAVGYLRESKRITRQKYASLLDCSIRTAFNDLQNLVDRNVIQRKGKGKYTYFELV